MASYSLEDIICIAGVGPLRTQNCAHVFVLVLHINIYYSRIVGSAKSITIKGGHFRGDFIIGLAPDCNLGSGFTLWLLFSGLPIKICNVLHEKEHILLTGSRTFTEMLTALNCIKV